MQTEYEATFADISKEDIRDRLKRAGAVLARSEFLQKRVNFDLPKESTVAEGWIRVRDEGDRVTMSIKSVMQNETIDGQKELCLTVDSFPKAQEFVTELLGYGPKAYQESKREVWKMGSVEICIDEWPWLPPFVEIEGNNEAEVKEISERLGFVWDAAIFGAVDVQYEKKYGVSRFRINCKTPRFVFGEECPFLTKNRE